jgi:hypothetical protein
LPTSGLVSPMPPRRLRRTVNAIRQTSCLSLAPLPESVEIGHA